MRAPLFGLLLWQVLHTCSAGRPFAGVVTLGVKALHGPGSLLDITCDTSEYNTVTRTRTGLCMDKHRFPFDTLSSWTSLRKRHVVNRVSEESEKTGIRKIKETEP